MHRSNFSARSARRFRSVHADTRSTRSVDRRSRRSASRQSEESAQKPTKPEYAPNRKLTNAIKIQNEFEDNPNSIRVVKASIRQELSPHGHRSDRVLRSVKGSSARKRQFTQSMSPRRGAPAVGTSLNYTRRLNEQKKQLYENIKLLHKIQNVKPTVAHSDLQLHAKRQSDMQRMYRVNSSHGKMALVHAARHHAIKEHLTVRESSRKKRIRSKKPST